MKGAPASPLTDTRWRVAGTSSLPPRRAMPMSRAEMRALGWDQCDIILVTGDAYVDHPGFGTAFIGRFLCELGYRVGILAQPDCQTVDSFRPLGTPRLFWGIAAGNLDSQLARLTVMRKRRRDDPYAAGGNAGLRPAYASVVYAGRVREVAKGIPVVLGGLEASLRRFAFYDFWTDKVRRSVLADAKADLLVYGMGERAVAEVARRLHNGGNLHGIPGTAEFCREVEGLDPMVALPSFEEVSAPDPSGRTAFAHMTAEIHRHLDPGDPCRLVQRHGDRFLVVHPAPAPLTPVEMDFLYALPFTRRPHPAYTGSRIPAWEMIRESITTHRGCYAGCAFCAIRTHQGRHVQSRTRQGILAEVSALTRDPDFKGTISDVGGPTANMYGTGCRLHFRPCTRPSCLHPSPCPNLDANHAPVRNLLRAVREQPGVRHAFVTSGIRFDLALREEAGTYIEELARHHVCGRLKIAPEHISTSVLNHMRKPDAHSHLAFLDRFQAASRAAGKPHQVVEYYISGHPGCTLDDMILLARHLRRHALQPEQVQDFYPAPLTLAAAMFYTGLDPLTGRPVHVARSDREKSLQRALLLSHLPAFHRKAREALRLAHREDLIGRGPEALVPPGP